MLLARVKIKNFLPEERGTPSPGPLPPEPWPCHIPSKLLMLLILTEMQLKRFKKQKSPTQGKGTPLSSDHNPLQPWPFAYAKYPIDVPYFNLLYRALYSFNYYKKKLKSGRKMRLARFLNQKFSYPVKGDIPSFGYPSQPQSFAVRHVPRILLMFSYSNLYLSFCKELCMVKLLQKG